jgi:hypothetical protein
MQSSKSGLKFINQIIREIQSKDMMRLLALYG